MVVIGEKCPTRVKGRGIVRAGEMSGGNMSGGSVQGKMSYIRTVHDICRKVLAGVRLRASLTEISVELRKALAH